MHVARTLAKVLLQNGSMIERSGSRVDFRRFPIKTETLREFRYRVSAFIHRVISGKVFAGY